MTNSALNMSRVEGIHPSSLVTSDLESLTRLRYPPRRIRGGVKGMADMDRPPQREVSGGKGYWSGLDTFALPANFREPTTSEHGWMLPNLLTVDATLTGRWDYLTACWYRKDLIDYPIPRIDFESTPDSATSKMLAKALDSIPNQGHEGWQGWSSSEYIRFLLEWLLHGFGHQAHKEAPNEPFGCEGASERLRNTLNLDLWLAHPHDYLGEMLAQNAYGKRQGFFPTPHTICQMMVMMTIDRNDADARSLSVMDPCVGTGRMLLHASNYSL
ncbi:MAG: SAM-dependent DNA methyltransferase, partial [Alphaproteobacteria bacterium]